ncbi:MAG: DUF1640 domain-containing protein [Deltaproteobacteria bacterium]|nr:MAG: DUF1640 domain-containing protein [Deltaproteobacteria bacterium]
MDITFDSLGYFEKLTQVGVPEAQAKVQVESLREVIDTTQQYLATKKDLEAVKFELQRDIQEVRRELQRDIRESEQRTIIRLGALLAVYSGIILGILKLVS